MIRTLALAAALTVALPAGLSFASDKAPPRKDAPRIVKAAVKAQPVPVMDIQADRMAAVRRIALFPVL